MNLVDGFCISEMVNSPLAAFISEIGRGTSCFGEMAVLQGADPGWLLLDSSGFWKFNCGTVPSPVKPTRSLDLACFIFYSLLSIN